jgi:hypothetical protein
LVASLSIENESHGKTVASSSSMIKKKLKISSPVLDEKVVYSPSNSSSDREPSLDSLSGGKKESFLPSSLEVNEGFAFAFLRYIEKAFLTLIYSTEVTVFFKIVNIAVHSEYYSSCTILLRFFFLVFKLFRRSEIIAYMKCHFITAIEELLTRFKNF